MPFLNLQKKNFEVWHIPFRKIIEYVKKIIWNLNDSSLPHIKTHSMVEKFQKKYRGNIFNDPSNSKLTDFKSFPAAHVGLTIPAAHSPGK